MDRVLRGREVRGGEYLFCSERRAKLTRNGFWRVVSEAGKRAGLPMNVYTHPLRHASGYYLEPIVQPDPPSEHSARQRISAALLSPPLSATLMILPAELREPTRAPRRRRCGSRRASRRACREHHRTRRARAALSSGARAERERPAQQSLTVSLPWLPVGRCGRRGLSGTLAVSGASRHIRKRHAMAFARTRDRTTHYDSLAPHTASNCFPYEQRGR